MGSILMLNRLIEKICHNLKQFSLSPDKVNF